MVKYQATATLVNGIDNRPIAVMGKLRELETYVEQCVIEHKGQVRDIAIEKVITQLKPVFLQRVVVVKRTRYAWNA